jgi:formylglycine-generating enzyme
MKKERFWAVVVCVMAVVNFASADNIRGINMDFVTIGNAGNTADTHAMINGTHGGAVSYDYSIGKYEVTNAQWNSFTAAAGAPTGNDGDYRDSARWTGAQQPTDSVSWYEAAQFCNYLTSGDKSKGAYQFSGDNANPGSFQGIDRVSSISTYGTTYIIPTEDEWYKAAYFKPDGSGYSLYANGTDTAPVAGVNSNYGVDSNHNSIVGASWNVGMGTMEQNGTFDMMGNVLEWNETLFYGSLRGIRGGTYSYDAGEDLKSSFSSGMSPIFEGIAVGFRIAEVPEPATICLLTLGGIFIYRRRKP